MSKINLKTECERCGECCRKGGPALHKEDMALLNENYFSRESLITIRRGEPIFFLEKNRPEWTRKEIVKLKGVHGGWTCTFYDRDKTACSIYQNRPRECVLLKCWDTAELEAVAGRNLLSRADIIGPAEPVARYIETHEKNCNLDVLEKLDIKHNVRINESLRRQLTELVNRDLAIRSEAVAHLDLSLDLELFYFGRPLFKILSQFALNPKEVNGKIILTRT